MSVATHALKLFTGAALLGLPLCLAGCDQSGDGSGNTPVAAPASEEYVAPRYVVPESESEAVSATVVEEFDTTDWRIQPPFYAAGREPGWQLDIEDGWFVFRRLGLPEIDTQVVPPVQDGEADLFDSNTFRLTLTPGSCSSPEDGAAVKGQAEVLFEGVTFTGCVYEGESLAGDVNDSVVWTDDIFARLIEIDACLAAVEDGHGLSTQELVVTSVFPRDGGATGVALKANRGRYFECASNSLGDVSFADPLDEANLADWMDVGGHFLRLADAPPPENCLEAEPVEVDGVTLGYLLEDACKY